MWPLQYIKASSKSVNPISKLKVTSTPDSCKKFIYIKICRYYTKIYVCKNEKNTQKNLVKIYIEKKNKVAFIPTLRYYPESLTNRLKRRTVKIY